MYDSRDEALRQSQAGIEGQSQDAEVWRARDQRYCGLQHSRQDAKKCDVDQSPYDESILNWQIGKERKPGGFKRRMQEILC